MERCVFNDGVRLDVDMRSDAAGKLMVRNFHYVLVATWSKLSNIK